MTEYHDDDAFRTVAEQAADRAVREVFLRLGIDVDDREALASAMDDFSFLKRMNRGAKEVKSTTIKTAVGAIIAAVFALLVLGFKETVLSWFHPPIH